MDFVLISSPVGEKEIKRVMVVEREEEEGGGGVEGFQIASPAFCLLCRASFFNLALRVNWGIFFLPCYNTLYIHLHVDRTRYKNTDFSGVTSLDLKWDSKTYKLKRSSKQMSIYFWSVKILLEYPLMWVCIFDRPPHRGLRALLFANTVWVL